MDLNVFWEEYLLLCIIDWKLFYVLGNLVIVIRYIYEPDLEFLEVHS